MPCYSISFPDSLRQCLSAMSYRAADFSRLANGVGTLRSHRGKRVWCKWCAADPEGPPTQPTISPEIWKDSEVFIQLRRFRKVGTKPGGVTLALAATKMFDSSAPIPFTKSLGWSFASSSSKPIPSGTRHFRVRPEGYEML